MRLTITLMALVLVGAACGTPTSGDEEVAATPPTTEVEDTGESGGDDEAESPEPDDDAEFGEDGATPTGTDQRSEESSDEDSIGQSVDPGDGSNGARENSADQRDAKEPERVEDEPVSEPVTGEVPAEMIAQVMDDLSSRTGAATSHFLVVRAESVVWNDGSLGCPQPGMTYTMALVDGYWIEIDHNGDIHDYRASAKGYFVYCEGGGIGPINPNA